MHVNNLITSKLSQNNLNVITFQFKIEQMQTEQMLN